MAEKKIDVVIHPQILADMAALPAEEQDALRQIFALFRQAAEKAGPGADEETFSAELERLTGIAPEPISDDDVAELERRGLLGPLPSQH